MAWIESHQELGQHPKTKRLARTLGINLVTVVGHLQYLWWWAIDYAEDGDITAFDDGEIADAALWEGDAATFVMALIRSGFVDQSDTAMKIHDWDTYAGRLIAARKGNAKRQRDWRERHRYVTHIKEEQSPLRNASVTVTSPLHNPTTVPNPTEPNPTGPEIVSSAEETAPNGAPSFRSILDQARTDLESPKANKVGITGRVFENVYGRKPVNGFMAALIRDYEAPYDICCLMVELVGHWNGSDDPQRYLSGALKKKRERTYGNGRAPPANPYMTDAELAEKTRLDREQLDAIVAQDRKRWQH